TVAVRARGQCATVITEEREPDDVERHGRFISQRFGESAFFSPAGVPDLDVEILLEPLQRGSVAILDFRTRRIVRDDHLGGPAVALAVLEITPHAGHQAGWAIAC